MHLNIEWQLQFGRAPQTLAQNLFFDLKLMLVCGVLVVASAAASIILTSRLDAMRRGLDYGLGLGPRESRLLFGEGSFDFFCFQDEGNEYGFAAASSFIRVRIRR